MAGFWEEFFGGEEPKTDKIDTMDPRTKELHDKLISGLKGNLSGSLDYFSKLINGDEETYKAWAEPYETKFREETVPMLGERYAGMGSNSGALSSSGFAQSLSTAGKNLNTDLASLYANKKENAANKLLDMIMQSMGIQTQAIVQQPGSAGAGGPLASAAIGGATNALVGMAGDYYSNKNQKSGQNTNQSGGWNANGQYVY